MNEFIGPILDNCSILMPGVEELLNITQACSVEKSVEKLFRNPKLEIIALKKRKQRLFGFYQGGAV